MTTMLLDDKASEGLTDDKETALIEIMSCCCRQAATGQGPPGRFIKRVSRMIEIRINYAILHSTTHVNSKIYY